MFVLSLRESPPSDLCFSSALGLTSVCSLTSLCYFIWLKLFFFVVLVESWDQCKDADVLLESPSAMAGVHIAEALRESSPG